MASIPGASAFLSSARLANSQGLNPSTPSIFGNSGGLDAAGILEVGRRINRSGIGLSSRARAANKQFLSSAASNANTMFSLGVAETSSIEALQKKILALRSSLPESQLSRAVRGQTDAVGTDAIDDFDDSEEIQGSSSSVLSSGSSLFSTDVDGISSSSNGSTVDTEA